MMRSVPTRLLTVLALKSQSEMNDCNSSPVMSFMATLPSRGIRCFRN